MYLPAAYLGFFLQLPCMDTSGCQSLLQPDGRPQVWDGGRVNMSTVNHQMASLADNEVTPARPFMVQRYVHRFENSV